MLKISNLVFAYPGQTRPYNFNLHLAPAQIVTVTGPSGSGKSTLLDLIAGFLTPTNGSITLDGTDITSQRVEDRPVSILHQSDNLFDHLSVEKNLALGLPKSTPAKLRHELTEQSLRDVELEGFAKKRAANLSGGQKQRVALARTLLLNRPVLLLDEPFAALDPETAMTMRALVKRLVKERNWCALVVSHNLMDVTELGARHCEIRDSQLVDVT